MGAPVRPNMLNMPKSASVKYTECFCNALDFSYRSGVEAMANDLRRQYLVSDLDKEDEDDDNKQVVEDTNNANGGVDDLECKVTHREHIRRDVVIFQQGRCNVRNIIRQR